MRSLLTACALIVAAAAASAAGALPSRPGPAPLDQDALPQSAPATASALFADRPFGGGRSAAAAKAPARVDAILVMCDFSDSLMFGRWGLVEGDFPPPMQGEILYSAHDSVFFDHLARDVDEYFTTVSGGAFDLNVTVHGRTVNLPQAMAYYGNHPESGERPVELARDVMDSLAAEIDFGAYDTVILVHAGAGEETDVLGDSPEQIYSTYLDPDDIAESIEEEILPPGGLPGGIEHVLVLPECEYQDAIPPYGNGMYGSLGVYCYEVGLRLGMLPLVDFTPAGRPDSQGIGTLGLMGYGLFVYAGWSPPYPCAYNRALMGWQDAAVVGPGETFGLTPAGRVGEPAALARVDIAPQEYWLLEYRLQDPDGDRFWSFAGDLNGNFRRDFVDASTADGVPEPGAKFDPDEDVREWLTGAEWDHFMTENGATIPGLGGGGSGVYVWHIDESVIAAALAEGSNGFNADPARKSVDLEEADGIQDLDSAAPTRWFLGADDDPFRGGGSSLFGPDTMPRTDTATGVATGYRFSDFGPVVLDSFAYLIWTDGVDSLYAHTPADTVPFTLARVAAGAVQPSAERMLAAGVDLRGSDVLLVDLDGSTQPTAAREIVLADRDGGVWALDGDLREYVDHDGNPATVAPLATGRRQGAAVSWRLPPAVGDLDGDGAPEIVLATADGLYAFDRDGAPVRDVEPGADGLYADLGENLLPAVLLPLGGGAIGDPGSDVAAVVVVRAEGRTRLRSFAGPDATPALDVDLGEDLPAGAPVAAFGRLWLAMIDTASSEGRLLAVDTAAGSAEPVRAYSLDIEPGLLPVSWGVEESGATSRWIAVPGNEGGQTVWLDDNLDEVRSASSWYERAVLDAPAAAGGAVTAGGIFGRLTAAGDWLTGWPQRPEPEILPGDAAVQAGALVAGLGDEGQDGCLFTAPDGRIFAYGLDGGLLRGWPVAGPGAAAGTPGLGQVGGDLALDLVTVGTSLRLAGVGADGRSPETVAVSVIAVFADVATDAAWPMAGGSAWRNGAWEAEAWSSPPPAVGGNGLVEGSHVCYPNPLVSGPLQVRARAAASGRARAVVHDLAGEVVAESVWRDAPAREPFTVSVDLGTAASGMYLCRLVFEADGGGRDVSVQAFAVER
jgi:M6 family metalloprotease-like protein